MDTSGFPAGQKVPTNLKSKSYKFGSNYQPSGVASLFLPAPEAAAPAGRETPVQSPEAVPEKAVDSPPEALKKIPGPTTRRKKTTEEKQREKERNEAEMATAREIAKGYAVSILRQTLDPEGRFIGRDADGEASDQEKLSAYYDNMFKVFTAWRTMQSKEGDKPPPIYSRDKRTGAVSVLKENLEAQYRQYLDEVVLPGVREENRRRKKAEEEAAARTKEAQEKLGRQHAAMAREMVQRVASGAAAQDAVLGSGPSRPAGRQGGRGLGG